MGKKIINKWKDYDPDNNAYQCPYCNEVYWNETGDMVENKFNFCPNCGSELISTPINRNLKKKMKRPLSPEAKRLLDTLHAFARAGRKELFRRR